MERILAGTNGYGVHRGSSARPSDLAALQLPDGNSTQLDIASAVHDKL